jgi:hypothetical protein
MNTDKTPSPLPWRTWRTWRLVSSSLGSLRTPLAHGGNPQDRSGSSAVKYS